MLLIAPLRSADEIFGSSNTERKKLGGWLSRQGAIKGLPTNCMCVCTYIYIYIYV